RPSKRALWSHRITIGPRLNNRGKTAESFPLSPRRRSAPRSGSWLEPSLRGGRVPKADRVLREWLKESGRVRQGGGFVGVEPDPDGVDPSVGGLGGKDHRTVGGVEDDGRGGVDGGDTCRW